MAPKRRKRDLMSSSHPPITHQKYPELMRELKTSSEKVDKNRRKKAQLVHHSSLNLTFKLAFRVLGRGSEGTVIVKLPQSLPPGIASVLNLSPDSYSDNVLFTARPTTTIGDITGVIAERMFPEAPVYNTALRLQGEIWRMLGVEARKNRNQIPIKYTYQLSDLPVTLQLETSPGQFSSFIVNDTIQGEMSPFESLRSACLRQSGKGDRLTVIVVILDFYSLTGERRVFHPALYSLKPRTGRPSKTKEEEAFDVMTQTSATPNTTAYLQTMMFPRTYEQVENEQSGKPLRSMFLDMTKEKVVTKGHKVSVKTFALSPNVDVPSFLDLAGDRGGSQEDLDIRFFSAKWSIFLENSIDQLPRRFSKLGAAIDMAQTKADIFRVNSNCCAYLYEDKAVIQRCDLKAVGTLHVEQRGRFKEARGILLVPSSKGKFGPDFNGFPAEKATFYGKTFCIKKFIGPSRNEDFRREINTAFFTEKLWKVFQTVVRCYRASLLERIDGISVIIPWEGVFGKEPTHNERRHRVQTQWSALIEPYIRGIEKVNSNTGEELKVDSLNKMIGVAFSHFTYDVSGGQIVVCDIQINNEYITDPIVHTTLDLQVSAGNLKAYGIRRWATGHTCNDLCDQLGLTDTSEGTIPPPNGNVTPPQHPPAHGNIAHADSEDSSDGSSSIQSSVSRHDHMGANGHEPLFGTSSDNEMGHNQVHTPPMSPN
eukprot:Nk52_evm12s1916 gene=Nk52_evmTU12s1916